MWSRIPDNPRIDFCPLFREAARVGDVNALALRLATALVGAEKLIPLEIRLTKSHSHRNVLVDFDDQIEWEKNLWA